MSVNSPSKQVLPPVDLAMVDPFVRALLARAPLMNFYQLCQLLERQAPDRPGFGTRDTPEHEPVRFRPRPGMGFPAGEIAGVEFDPDRPNAPPTLRTTFMGLYGVNAVMPSHLIDDIVLRREGHEAVMAFADQFNHRIVTLLYRAWKKYRYPAGFGAGGTDRYSRALLCLSGFGLGNKPARAGLPDARVLALLGLLNQRTRTAEGIAGAVALAVPGAQVQVEEFHPVWVKVANPVRLGRDKMQPQNDGRAMGLGKSTILGRRIRWRGKAVQLTLRPADQAQVHGLLPDAPLHRELMAFLRIYVGVKADVIVRMQVSSALVPAPTLGQASVATATARASDDEASDDPAGSERAAIAPGRLAWTTLLKPSVERLMTIPLGRYEAVPSTRCTPSFEPAC